MVLHVQAVLWDILSTLQLELVNCVIRDVISVQEWASAMTVLMDTTTIMVFVILVLQSVRNVLETHLIVLFVLKAITESLVQESVTLALNFAPIVKMVIHAIVAHQDPIYPKAFVLNVRLLTVLIVRV